MSVSRYLPSAQFATVALSLGVSAGLVFAAQLYVQKENTPTTLAAATDQAAQDQTNWQQSLEQIQAQSGISLPPPPDENTLGTLLGAAKSPNTTDTVARTLFVNLSSAAAQGLGSDLPTQNQVIAQAFAQLAPNYAPAHTQDELQITADTPEALRAYGNATVATFQQYPEANAVVALQLIGSAVDNDDKTYFDQLKPIEHAYQNIATGLLAAAVPQTLSPLHLSLINNLENAARALTDIQTTPEDPLRGLVGMQQFQLSLNETQRVLTTIAQQLNKDDILFTKDEPGSALSAFLGTSS